MSGKSGSPILLARLDVTRPAALLSLTTHNPNPQPQPRIFPTTKRQLRNKITTTSPTARTNKTTRTRIYPNSKSRTHRHRRIPENIRSKNSHHRMVHRQFPRGRARGHRPYGICIYHHPQQHRINHLHCNRNHRIRNLEK